MSKQATLQRWFMVTAFLLVAMLAGCDRAKSTAKSPQPAPASDDLQKRLNDAIEFTRAKRHPDTQNQAAWQIVHGLLSYGRGLEIRHDGKLVPAAEYLLQGGSLNGWKMSKADHGVATVVEPATKTGQGHPDQWLGYLSQCGLSTDEPLVVAGEKFTVNDLVTQAQWEVRQGREGTFTLMALATYLPSDAKWMAGDGSEWSIERLVGMEAEQDANEAEWLEHLRDSACGGSHRMFGIASALKQYRQTGQPLNGAWKTADERVRLAIDKAHQHQQPDGSFSTEFFLRPATKADLVDKLHATGHTLEFLALAMSDEELKAPWVTNAVDYLVSLFESTQEVDLECGALYHASHALILYRDRVYGGATTASK